MQNNSWLKTLNRDEERSRKKEMLVNVSISILGIAATIVAIIFLFN